MTTPALADTEVARCGRIELDGEVAERRHNRGRAAVDRERAAAARDAAAATRDKSQARADQENWARGRAADGREHAADDRDEHVSGRGKSQAKADLETRARGRTADGHEHSADDRDQEASDRDHTQAQAERRARRQGPAAADRGLSASDRGRSRTHDNQRISNRTQAARDREHAAADRQHAVADRTEAERDDENVRAELRRAQLDHLTGAFGRELGMLLLGREINRAHHANGLLVLAYIDVDELKLVNDRQGHGAGDELLQQVAHAIQAHLRSYDTLVRVGGDEFVCGLVDCTPVVARGRFEQIRAMLQQTQPSASISVGYAELRPDDQLDQLISRADLGLYAAKLSSRRPTLRGLEDDA